MCISFHLMATKMNPGYLENNDVDFLEMLKIIDPT